MTAEQRASHALSQLGRLQAKAEDNERKRANKIRFLLGSAVETMMRKDPALRARIEAFMAGFLTRKVDRNAFDLDAEQNYFARLTIAAPEEVLSLSVLGEPGKVSAADRDAKHDKGVRALPLSTSPPVAASGNGTATAARPALTHGPASVPSS